MSAPINEKARPDSEYTLCPPRVMRGLLHLNVQAADVYGIHDEKYTVSETMRSLGCLWRIRLVFGASISMYLEPMGTCALGCLQVRFRILSKATSACSEMNEAAEMRHRKRECYGIVHLIPKSSLVEDYGPSVVFEAHIIRRMFEKGTSTNTIRPSIVPLVEDFSQLYEVLCPPASDFASSDTLFTARPNSTRI